MSLILEALRKSEAERRRGKVPDLHVERPPEALAARDGPPAWLWLALALATVAVLALVLWFARTLLATPPPAIAGPEQETGRAPAPAVARTAEPGEPGDGALASPPEITPAVLPASTDYAPAPSPPAMAREQQRAPVMATATPIAPATAAPPPRPAAAASPAATASIGSTAAVTAPNAATRPEPSFAAVPADATPAVATTAPAGSAPLRLGDLSSAERKQLPALRMSMHMWSPTQRFAIIDGVRVVEGDRVGDAVVEAITANAVLLDWQGRRLQIPTR